MASVRGILLWSKRQYTTSELISDVQLPAIIKVIQVSPNATQQTNNVQLGDIIRVDSVISQTRLVAAIEQEGEPHFISIPQSRSVKLKKKGKRTNANKKLHAKDVVEKGKFPVVVEFRNKKPVRIDGKEYDAKDIGHVDIQETRDEKFLQVNFIKSVAVGKEVVFLSATLNFKILVAVGLDRRTEKDWQDYQDMLSRACRRHTRISVPRNIHYISYVYDEPDNKNKTGNRNNVANGIHHPTNCDDSRTDSSATRQVEYNNSIADDSVDLQRMNSETSLDVILNGNEDSLSSSSNSLDIASFPYLDYVGSQRRKYCCW